VDNGIYVEINDKSFAISRGYFSTGSVTFLMVPRTFLRAAAFNRYAKSSTF